MESPLSASAERVNEVKDEQFSVPVPPDSRSARIQSGDYVTALHILPAACLYDLAEHDSGGGLTWSFMSGDTA